MHYALKEKQMHETNLKQTGGNKMHTIANLDTVKAKMKGAWNAGDYGRFATYMEPGAIEILNNWKIKPGQTMLDVACGTGQISIPAARRISML